MHPISRFSLEQHAGPYDTWPTRSRLLLDGEPTRILLPSYALLSQFEIPDAYILVTDYDCPFEEITSFCLVSKELRLPRLSMKFLREAEPEQPAPGASDQRSRQPER